MSNEELLERINKMTHAELGRVWRFASGDDPMLHGEPGKRLSERFFKEFGGWTTEISKQVGWTK